MTEFFYNTQLCREGRVLCSTESHFLFVKDVLDLWYSGDFMFIAVERFSKHQQDKATQQRRNKEAVRFHDWQ